VKPRPSQTSQGSPATTGRGGAVIEAIALEAARRPVYGDGLAAQACVLVQSDLRSRLHRDCKSGQRQHAPEVCFHDRSRELSALEVMDQEASVVPVQLIAKGVTGIRPSFCFKIRAEDPLALHQSADQPTSSSTPAGSRCRC
jgi:hypothetical protein